MLVCSPRTCQNPASLKRESREKQDLPCRAISPRAGRIRGVRWSWSNVGRSDPLRKVDRGSSGLSGQVEGNLPVGRQLLIVEIANDVHSTSRRLGKDKDAKDPERCFARVGKAPAEVLSCFSLPASTDPNTPKNPRAESKTSTNRKCSAGSATSRSTMKSRLLLCCLSPADVGPGAWGKPIGEKTLRRKSRFRSQGNINQPLKQLPSEPSIRVTGFRLPRCGRIGVVARVGEREPQPARRPAGRIRECEAIAGRNQLLHPPGRHTSTVDRFPKPSHEGFPTCFWRGPTSRRSAVVLALRNASAS